MLETLWSTLTPFIWGGALALVLNIPLRLLEDRLSLLRHSGVRRVAALSLVMLGFAAALVLGLWLLVPQLVAAAADLAAALPQLWQTLQETLAGAGTLGAAAAQGLAELADGNTLEPFWQAGMAAAKSTAGAVGQIFLAVVLAVYLLAGKETNLRRARQVCLAALGEEKTRRLGALAQQAADIFSGFIAGQCLEACILAGLFVLTLLVCHMPYVLPISAVIGVTALVPVFGAWIGCCVGVLLILPVSLKKAGWFVVLFLCVQQFENNVIYPRVVGGRIGLPPLWVLTAVLLGGGIFGAPGLVLGIPAVSVLYHVGGDWVHGRLAGKRSPAEQPSSGNRRNQNKL